MHDTLSKHYDNVRQREKIRVLQIFTVPIGDHEKIKNIKGIRQIGYITKESLGCMLSTRDDNEFQLEAQGWNPIRDEK